MMAPSTSSLLFLSLSFLSIASANSPWSGGNWGDHDQHSPWKPTGTWDPYCAPTGRPHFQPSPVVVLPSGPVIGTTTSLPSATAVVNQFLGIPFAHSPPERFSPPQDAGRWWQPLNATTFKPACVQQFNYPLASQQFTKTLFNNPAPLESEDCLYLNVFAPSTPAPKAGRAVLFWIYGGSLQFGSAGLPEYDGSNFAAFQDVIVVTINYRTNVFGFSNSPQIPVGQQNSGFLDQRKALEWVQGNIARFGGDPAAVTIFGESAGGYSVKQLLANPPSPLTYRAAIMQSEASATGNGSASWTRLLTLLNCTALNGPSGLACARAAPATTIKSIIETNSLVFPPVADNVTSSSNVAQQLRAKTFAHVPFFLGTNSEEGRVFAVGRTNVSAYLTANGLSALAPYIQASYPAPQTPTEAYEQIADIITDVVFQCPALTLANTAIANGYTDAWRYYYNASFPNVMPFPDAGVFHSSEIPEVFGTYNRTGATTQQITLSAYMQSAWADFAKNPSQGPGWPRWESTVKDLADLGGNGVGGEFEIDPATVDGRCAIYAPVYALTGI